MPEKSVYTIHVCVYVTVGLLLCKCTILQGQLVHNIPATDLKIVSLARF